MIDSVRWKRIEARSYDNWKKTDTFLYKILIDRAFESLKKLGYDIKGRVIVIGVGQGYEALYLKGRYCTSVMGLNLSSSMIKRAKSNLSEVILGDAENMPFRDDCFDLSFGYNVLHHLPNPYQAIQELLRVGRIFCGIDIVNTFLTKLLNVFGLFKIEKHTGLPPNRLSYDKIRQLGIEKDIKFFIIPCFGYLKFNKLMWFLNNLLSLVLYLGIWL